MRSCCVINELKKLNKYATGWPKWCKKLTTNSKVVVDVLLSFARWRHYFHKLIQISYDIMFNMKWLWFVANLVRICSIFLKLQTVKTKWPSFFLPCIRLCTIHARNVCHAPTNEKSKQESAQNTDWMRKLLGRPERGRWKRGSGKRGVECVNWWGRGVKG